MIEPATMRGRTVAVLGLARSGRVAAAALARAGARVLAWDDDRSTRDSAAMAGIPLADLSAEDWSRVDGLLISPGIPQSFPRPHPVAEKARQARVKIFGDIELLAQNQRESTYIGITGTNGKSTTTALVGHLLAGAGQTVAVGGNIGTPVLSLPALGATGTYVLEMSSYQLEITLSHSFDVAVLINVSPDHLDRHGGMTGYVAAKRRIFLNARAGQAAVVGVDDETCRAIRDDLAREGVRRVIAISSGRRADVFAAEGKLHDAMDGAARAVLDLADCPALPGRHNWQNAAAAYAVARARGVAPEVAAAGLKTFPGLAHRQEAVARIGHVSFVNDSKATNADAARVALETYRNIYWIAGGVAKEGGIASLAPWFERIRRAYLIGQAADDFAVTLDGVVDHVVAGTLARAVELAARDAAADQRPAVVLLSPACASFDQFANFEARGDAFRALARQLAGALA